MLVQNVSINFKNLLKFQVKNEKSESNYIQERKKELQKNQFSAPFPATFYGAENADLFEYTILWQLIR